MQILRTNTKGNGLANISLLIQNFAFLSRYGDRVVVEGQGYIRTSLTNNSIDQGSSAERR